MRRLRATAAGCGVLLALTACTPDAGTQQEPDQQVFESNVDVDTPELRAAKRAAGVADCRPGRGEPVSGGLPDVELPCLGGGPDVNLAQLRGPLVLNLWASWCGPCKEELPFYQRLHEQAGGRLQVLGVDYQDTQPLEALELFEQAGVTYPSLADPGGELHTPFRVRGLPGVAFVDESGKVVHLEYVVIRSYAQLAGLVEEHLGVDA